MSSESENSVFGACVPCFPASTGRVSGELEPWGARVLGPVSPQAQGLQRARERWPSPLGCPGPEPSPELPVLEARRLGLGGLLS